MQRLVGVVLPDEKRIDYALTLIYGVGWTRSHQVLEQAKIEKSARVKDLSDNDIKKIAQVLDQFKLEGDLREETSENIKQLKDMGSYRGMRHRLGLPTRGQRTRSNARTRRGKRRTVGALTKEAWAKLEQ